MISDDHFPTGGATAAVTAPTACSPGGKPLPRILVIDDDEALARGLAKLLTAHGFEVQATTHGRLGLQIVKSTAIDLVITDIFMEEMEGLEIIIHLRRERPKLRIIAMSGGSKLVGVDCLTLAGTLGAAKVLQKPVSIDLLLKTIRELFG